jgi:hypothetical protein
MSRIGDMCHPAEGRAQSTRRGVIAILLLVTLVGCQPDAPTSARVEVRSASLAKGGGSTSTLAVTATAPTSAKQDTTVDVNVYGSGFTSGAAATWSLAGDTTQVHVQSTRFVNSGQLVARIVVPSAAPVASYDVVVTLIGGKKGVGAELFAVTVGDPSATYLFPLADATLNLRSDHASSDGTSSVYANGVCGLQAKIFATTQISNTGDATLDTGPQSKGRSCSRRFTVVYPDGFTESTGSFSNVGEIENTTYSIPVGATVKRAFRFGLNSSARCEALIWAATALGGETVPGDSALVTRTALDTWHVQSQPAPNNRAWCKPSGPSYNMDVDFTIKSSRPLP